MIQQKEYQEENEQVQRIAEKVSKLPNFLQERVYGVIIGIEMKIEHNQEDKY